MKLTALKRIPSFKGFTLIELLVVIGILGVLAAALIATLDPLEQTRRGRDTAKKQTAVEYVDAINRYYTGHNFMPWDSASPAPNCMSTSTPPYPHTTSDGATTQQLKSLLTGSCFTALTDDGEIKTTFAQLPDTTTTKLFVNYDSTNNATSVCFVPESKAQKKDTNTVYNADGSVNSSCPTVAAGTTCYWCAR